MKKTGKHKIRAIITATGGTAVGGQILESLHLRRDLYYTIATDIDVFSFGLYEADEAFITPKRRGYIQSLLKIAKDTKADVIIPGSQIELVLIAQQEKEFLRQGVVPITNPYSLIKKCFDKYVLTSLLNRHNILTPPTVLIKHPKDAEVLEFPIVIKPSKNSCSSRGVHIIKDPNELDVFYKKLNMEEVDFLAQEFIGSEDEEYTVGTVVGWDGRIIDTLVMRKYITGINKGEQRVIGGKTYVLSGAGSQGFYVNQPDVKKLCEEVCVKIGARGPVNIQIRRGKKGLYVFEVHPRFSGSTFVRAQIGFNEAHVLIQEALGLKQYANIPHELRWTVMRKLASTIVKTPVYESLKINGCKR